MNQLGKVFIQHYENEWDYYSNNLAIPLNVLIQNGMTTKNLVKYCRFIEQLKSILICASMNIDNQNTFLSIGKIIAHDFLDFFSDEINEHLNPEVFFVRIYNWCDTTFFWEDNYHSTPSSHKDNIGTLYITFDDFRVELECILAIYAQNPDGEMNLSAELSESYFELSAKQLYEKMKKLEKERERYENDRVLIDSWSVVNEESPITYYNQLALCAKRYARLRRIDYDIEAYEDEINTCYNEQARRYKQQQTAVCCFPSCNDPVYNGSSYCKYHYDYEHYNSK